MEFGSKKWWRKLNNILHRDFGYLFVGMSVIYGISGIALNHLNDWNPSYSIEQYSFTPQRQLPDNPEEISAWLKEHNVDAAYKKHYKPSADFTKIFVTEGSVTVYSDERPAQVELIAKRPLFFQVNMLHYNPGWLWTVFSDIFSASLVLLAITGMFVLRGRNGLSGRGKWLVGVGVLIPIVLLLNYL